jgi:hypothetical protein
MDDLIITGSKDTPHVNFNKNSGILEISGQSYPESISEFYPPVINWLKKFIDTGNKIILNVKLQYFNTSSSKAILDILDILQDYHESGGNVTVNWYYEKDDEDILETGSEFKEDLTLTFNLLEY